MRLFVVGLAFLLAVVLVTAVSAQTGTASISGRISMDNGGDPPGNTLYVVPADTPQPLVFPQDGQYVVGFEPDNTFVASGLSGGDYLIAPIIEGVAFVSPLSNATVTTTADIPGARTVTFPAVRVTVADGQALTGVDIVLSAPQPCPSEGPCPLSPAAVPGEVSAPTSGSGSAEGGNTSALIGAAIAGAAVVLLGGGIALRVRQRRRA